ncbi:DUF448 domain-containing protein [Croceibacterium ferulae]|uniref:DUF448 domain-containing protein n=1 Tax=Croceibacterium ferulae TaxID=1854641 RepID=UPI000EB122F4|nr:DUF448 domain-containing protein [Croceibacterium ferulae]
MRNPRNEPLGDNDSDDAPERRCILSGSNAGRDAMLRLAMAPAGPDGQHAVLPDPRAQAPGRGAWIGVDRATLAEALAKGRLKGALARALRTGALAIPDDLPELAQTGLTRAFTERLGLEFRAGRLILGSDRIARAARDGKVAALFHAADASGDGARKLDQAWRVGTGTEGTGKSGLRLPLDRAALSVALGRDNVVHLALTDPGSAQRVTTPLQRLLNFLGAPADGAQLIEANEDGPDRVSAAPGRAAQAGPAELNLKDC